MFLFDVKNKEIDFSWIYCYLQNNNMEEFIYHFNNF